MRHRNQSLTKTVLLAQLLIIAPSKADCPDSFVSENRWSTTYSTVVLRGGFRDREFQVFQTMLAEMSISVRSRWRRPFKLGFLDLKVQILI